MNNKIKKKVAAIMIAAMTIGSVSPAFGNGLSEQEKRERAEEWARFEMETRNLPGGIRNELRNKFKAKLAEEDRRSQQAKDDFKAREEAGGWYLPEDKQFSEEEKSIHEANMKNTRESVNQKKESALGKVANYGSTSVTFAFCLSMTAFVSPNKIVGDDECADAIKNTCSLKRGYPHPARCAIFPTSAY